MNELAIAVLGLALWRALGHYIREERLRKRWQVRFSLYCGRFATYCMPQTRP